MGCVSSKQAVLVTPALDHSGSIRDNAPTGLRHSGRSLSELEKEGKSKVKAKIKAPAELFESRSELGGLGRKSSNDRGGDSLSFRLGNLHKYLEGEQVAAGWPSWLSSVAGDAIHGWLPLRSDAFEKLEKIGQGTYSSVFRARELEMGRIVALKKVRFDNFEPESVRFMAREITILRRLDHPNIVKLEGLITSRLSSSIYLVFKYMDHDITGLLSCPDVKFNESQIKCYMKQLLSGLEHCHSRGVMHRDIKGSNLLVNNEGVLKVADFGLANFLVSRNRRALTSRVVTLWYRPPELLLGSTDYGAAVDVWSVGCVFAELLVGKPVLQGRTEVEQLHKIFKLCGSPTQEYWNKSKLPNSTLFKPRQPYESCLRLTFKDFPEKAVSLLETLLSIEPYKRGTASHALSSEYFATEPHACDPSSMPKYRPSKEIDAKRTSAGGTARGVESRKSTRKYDGISKLTLAKDLTLPTRDPDPDPDRTIVINSQNLVEEPKSLTCKLEEAINKKHAEGDIPFSGRLQVSTSSGFAWAKRRKENSSIRSHNCYISIQHNLNPLEISSFSHARNNTDSKRHENRDFRTDSRGFGSSDIAKIAILNQWSKF